MVGEGGRLLTDFTLEDGERKGEREEKERERERRKRGRERGEREKRREMINNRWHAGQ